MVPSHVMRHRARPRIYSTLVAPWDGGLFHKSVVLISNSGLDMLVQYSDTVRPTKHEEAVVVYAAIDGATNSNQPGTSNHSRLCA